MLRSPERRWAIERGDASSNAIDRYARLVLVAGRAPDDRRRDIVRGLTTIARAHPGTQWLRIFWLGEGLSQEATFAASIDPSDKFLDAVTRVTGETLSVLVGLGGELRRGPGYRPFHAMTPEQFTCMGTEIGSDADAPYEDSTDVLEALQATAFRMEKEAIAAGHDGDADKIREEVLHLGRVRARSLGHLSKGGRPVRDCFAFADLVFEVVVELVARRVDVTQAEVAAGIGARNRKPSDERGLGRALRDCGLYWKGTAAGQ